MPSVTLQELLSEIADALVRIDETRERFREFQPGVGPYGEPQLVRLIAGSLNASKKLPEAAVTKRTPDLLIPKHWALEFKIARPFGDNGKEAENWSVNLLHPYEGNVSTIGDRYKLVNWTGPERRAVIVFGYEHDPAKISLTPLVESFEAIAKYIANIKLSGRVEYDRTGLVHPVHQRLRVFGWEVLGTN